MKKRSIVFIVVAIILVVVGVFTTNTSQETEAIANAVYVEDGKILPENDGKIVIIPGKIETVTPLVDKLTGVEIPHFKAQRNVEIYEKTSKTDENGNMEYVYDWKEVGGYEKNNFQKLEESELIADCKVGEFELDIQILDNISTGKSLLDFDTAGPRAKGFYVKYCYDTTYVSKMDYIPEGGESASGSVATAFYVEYEGHPRISYTVPQEDDATYTFIGRQQGNKLVYDKDLGMQAASAGLMTPEQLAENVKSGGMIGAVVAWVLAAFFVLLAVLSNKKKPELTEAEMREIENDIP